MGQQITGVVMDKNNNEPLIGASVIIKNTTIGTTTDFNGEFLIQSNKELPLILQISFIGYETLDYEITDVLKKIIIKISESSEVLKEVSVIEQRLSEKQKVSALTVESMDLLAIKQTPAVSFYEGLGQLKGVDLTTASLGFTIINTRGFNSTSPVRSLQLIDGVDNQSPGLNFSLGNFLGSSELDLKGVDLVAGASSAFYGPGAFNGVISMETKSPFVFPGISASMKVGERNLTEYAVRVADKFVNKKGENVFGYKVNVFRLTANDWIADNYNPTDQMLENEIFEFNPGGFDAINVYGDEALSRGNDYTDVSEQITFPGLGTIFRTGYAEEYLVDYNTENTKLNSALHFMITPKTELITSVSFGNGTTVYQGDNRYSLNNIWFLQSKFEIRQKDKFFFRFYHTTEDAGDSYDAVVTGFNMSTEQKPEPSWYSEYKDYWQVNFSDSIAQWDNFPVAPNFGSDPSAWTAYYENISNYMESISSDPENYYFDDLVNFHDSTRAWMDGAFTQQGWDEYWQPNSAEFDSVFNMITSKYLSEGGSLLYDRSDLYHAHAEYKFKNIIGDFTIGANARLYTPDTRGTIMDELEVNYFITDTILPNLFNPDTSYLYDSDTSLLKIKNLEYGSYIGLEKKLLSETMKLNFACRIDKNQNFNFLVSPAASMIYNVNEKNTLRLSFSSALRNPTLADQYLHYNVGRAILLGNVEGKFEEGRDSLASIESLLDYIDYFGVDTLGMETIDWFHVDRLRPERVKTIELGYRGTLFNRLYVDASYYMNWYTDFIGYQYGADAAFANNNQVTNVIFYRISANSKDKVVTQGFSAGLNYYMKDNITLNGNYTWNKLNKGSDDPLVPAYNTPRNKFNIGVTGYNKKTIFPTAKSLFSFKPNTLNFSINYKWIEGFLFEGSPQFTGFIDTYNLVDAQISASFTDWNTTIKLGASNLLNNKVYQVYGGPRVGRMAYFSVLYDFIKI